MMNEISLAISGIRTAADIAKAIISVNKDVAVDEKATELLSTIISLQNNLLSLQSGYFEAIGHAQELEEQLKQDHKWIELCSRYELLEVHKGIFVYGLKSLDGKEPNHWLCTACWESKRKSILIAEYHHESAASYICPVCKNVIRMKFRADEIITMPRQRSTF